MDRKFLLRAGFGWGLALWLFGYGLGIALFFVVSSHLIGWVIMPFGIVLALWVLRTRVTIDTFAKRLALAVIWTFLAVILDYIFIVKMVNPADGYYKADVILYYAITFALPFAVGASRSSVR